MRLTARKYFRVGEIKVEMGESLNLVACCWGPVYDGMFYLVTNVTGEQFLAPAAFIEMRGPKIEYRIAQ